MEHSPQFTRFVLASCLILLAGCSLTPNERRVAVKSPEAAKRLEALVSYVHAYDKGLESPKTIVTVTHLLMKDSSPLIRRIAADLLAKTKTPKAFENIKVLLKDKNPYVRKAALKALVRLNRKAAAPIVAKFLEGEKNLQVKRAAAQILGELGHPQAVVVLIATLADDDPSVRFIAGRALQEITGEMFAEDIVAWRRWFRARRKRRP